MQITKVQNLSKTELEQITKKRAIKKNKNMRKEELLISLLKTEQSLDEFRKTRSSNAEKQKKN